ncbi:MAG: signal recognition particle-docking protein FtsY [Gammaproteobacteria bacterium]|nr:signal recognition particle-docking protein FtsY [Gammaproteobacteria bacterium]
MFGSGDDKKTPQPAPRADTPETVEQAVSASAAKPVKKGLFSWFSKKTAEPQTPASRDAEPSVATADSSQHVQTAESVSTSVQPQAEPVSSSVKPEPAVIEQAAAAGQPTNSALVSSEAGRPVESSSAADTVSSAADSEPQQRVTAESALATTTASFAHTQADAQVATEPAPVLVAGSIPASSELHSESIAEPLQSNIRQTPELTAAPAAEAVPAQNLDTTGTATEAARPAYSRFRISGGSEVVAPPAPVAPLVIPEPAAQITSDAGAAKLDANLSGQDKPQDNKASWFARLKQGLAKTSSSLGEGMASLFLGKKEIDDDLLDELETRLLTADVGMEATTAIMANLTRRVARKELADSGALYQALQVEMADLLRPIEQPMQITPEKKPYVILVVGVNGAGKTTTIGKLAARLQKDGKKVMLAAGDTFRAAAVEQLQVWGERNKIPVIAQHTGADSASVIFDALQAAKSRGMDVLIADTAGRLHTKDNLMEELRKVGRVMSKLDDSAPHEVLLVLDAGTGQNAINQARQFNETIPLTGLALTKLDGTAKGGVIFALAKHFNIPVRYIGVGEGIDDLRDFVADDFVKALFAEKDSA